MPEPEPRRDRSAPRVVGPLLLALTGVALVLAVVPFLEPQTRLVPFAAAVACGALWWAGDRVAVARERTERYRRRLATMSRSALELQQLGRAEEVYEALPALLTEVAACRSARIVVPDGQALRVVASAGDTPPPASSETEPSGDEGARGGDGRGDAASGGAEAARVPSPATRAVRERRIVYDEGAVAPGTRPRRSAAVAAPGAAATTSTVAVPLFAADRLLAVLELRRDGAAAFTRRDREVIEVVARLAEEALARLRATEALQRRQRQSEGLARMSERLLLATDQAAAAETALRHVFEVPMVTSASVLRISGDRLVPIARIGDESSPAAALLDAGVPFRDGPLLRAWREGRTVQAADGADAHAFARGPIPILARNGAVVPVADARGATRALLVVANEASARPSPSSQRSMLTAIATALGATLQRLQLEQQLHELLDVVRALSQSEDPDELYAMAVEAAVRLIPGAEAATIMVRRPDGFYFAAGHGYEMDALRALGAFGYDAQVAWYGLGRDAFIRGVPRCLRGAEIARLSLAAADEAQETVLRRAGRVDDLRATITVPIAAGREVLGMLNVDNLSLEDAFHDHELDLAEAFGHHVGVIIRQTQAREALTRAAVTDALTGLGNREGFNRRLEQDLARSRRRGGEPVHLVMMDLDGFKRINDELGHDSGDEALIRVARALEDGLRTEDGLFRWGGDEFALIISGVDDEAVRHAADRHADAVAKVVVGGLPMSLSVGIASYPVDGHDAPALLRRADDLMYRHKHRHEDGSGKRR